MDRRDLILGVLVMLGGLAVISAAFGLPAGTATDPLGPRGFPLLLGVGLAACGAVLAATPLRWARPDTEPMEVTAHDDARAPFSWPRVGGAVAASLAFVFALVPLGALLTSIGYALALLLLQGRTGRREAAATAIAFPLLVYLLLDAVLGVPLPAGPLEPLVRALGI